MMWACESVVRVVPTTDDPTRSPLAVAAPCVEPHQPRAEAADRVLARVLGGDAAAEVARRQCGRARRQQRLESGRRERAAAEAVELLEVGAGDGRLCGLLTQELRQLAAEDAARLAPPLALTDGGFESALLSLGPTLEPEPDADDAPIWDLRCSDMLPGFHSPLERGTHPDVEVEMLEQSAAVAKFAPTLVLCSWMPGGEDWTATWRSAPSVKEYVLLGVPDTGVCGNEYRTWGVGRGDASVNLSPAEMDGFERVDVHAVSRWQLCCVDRPSFEEVGHSRCVSFRRTASGFEVV